LQGGFATADHLTSILRFTGRLISVAGDMKYVILSQTGGMLPCGYYRYYSATLVIFLSSNHTVLDGRNGELRCLTIRGLVILVSVFVVGPKTFGGYIFRVFSLYIKINLSEATLT
jgi:hypothetical protein